MAEIVQIGKKSTIIEGTEAQINEIRQKLHDLGFNFENYQYIELKPIETPKHSNNQASSLFQSQPAQKPQPQPASESQSDLHYEITKIENGYQIRIPQSKMDLVLSQFPIVRNVQKKRISKTSPNDPNSNYFFVLKPPCVEFNIYPPESSVDEHHVKETALRLLSLIE